MTVDQYVRKILYLFSYINCFPSILKKCHSMDSVLPDPLTSTFCFVVKSPKIRLSDSQNLLIRLNLKSLLPPH